MMQLEVKKGKIGDIPFHMVYPFNETGKSVILYHGWSSSGKSQLTRAALLALEGYTICVPDAVFHGERHPVSDYYTLESYDLFWKTIFNNIDEFPLLQEDFIKNGYQKPVIIGHSMGGMSVMGIAAKYGNEIEGAVSFNGSGDWELTHLFMQARFGYILGENWSLLKEIRQRSPLNHQTEMESIPLLLINGETDETVDPRGQMHFYNVMKNRNERIKKIIYPQLGHFVTTNMMDDAVQWMEEL